MINNTLFLLLVILALGEIIFGILCSIWLKRLDKTIDEMNRYRELTIDLYKINKATTDRISKDMIKISEIMGSNNDVYKKIVEAYDTMNQTYKIMTDAYHAVSDQFSRLLESWKNVEERYSDCFEQYKHTHECLKKVINLLEPTKFDEIAEGLKDLKKLNEPFNIQCSVDPIGELNPPEKCVPLDNESEIVDDDYFKSCKDFFNALAEMATEGETPPDPDAMKEFYETNGFEEIRKKALEEDS